MRRGGLALGSLDCRCLVFSLLLIVGSSNGKSHCITDLDCTAVFGQESICVDNACIGRYERGCLHQRSGSVRVCNSDDPADAEGQGLCRTPTIQHPEVRLYALDWESSIFQSWLLQVILSELLDVPTTIETGRLDINRNFYQNNGLRATAEDIVYDDFTGLVTTFKNVDRLGDCRRADKIPARYETCAHVAAENWQERTAVRGAVGEMIDNGIVEPPRQTGALGRRGLYIPRFTAERDPSLLSFLGLRGEENRRKLANTFLRPTTWKDYCEQVSPNNCTVLDAVAARAPRPTLLEENRYFVPGGLYNGHFRKTWKNECNSTNCTGHVTDFPCGMDSPLLPQLYHLDIALEGDGPMGHSRGYHRWQQKEIWRAANATRSNVAMYWFSPEPLFEEFLGTDAEFTKVSFPIPTQECMDHRDSFERCSAVLSNRVGDARATCEEPPTQLTMIISRALRNQTLRVPRAIQSPAYEAMKLFTLSDLRLAEMLDYAREEKTPSQAVCEWIEDNLEMIKERFVPPTYPRTLIEEKHTGWFSVAISLAASTTLLVLVTGRETYKQRLKPIIRNAQVDFLFLVLAGSLLVAVGAVIAAIPPSNQLCVTQAWLIHLGYTLSIVPQIVKVGAINRLMMAARRFQRLALDLRALYGAVVLLSGFVVAYLTIWIILDPPQKIAEYELTDNETDGKTVVSVAYTCASSTNLWGLIAISWNFVLLLCAVVLAFQTRHLQNDFNESQSLGNLIYANFVFLIFRAVSFIAASNTSSPVLPLVRSVIFSLDIVATVAIYFVPKFLADPTESTRPRPQFSRDCSDTGSFHGPHSNHRRGGTRASLRRIETPPTNPFLRFVTGISNITMQQGDDASDHAVEEGKAESKEDEELPPAEPESSSASSGTFDCDTVSDGGNDKVKSLLAQHEQTIARLFEENEQLRRRLSNQKNSESSGESSSTPPR